MLMSTKNSSKTIWREQTLDNNSLSFVSGKISDNTLYDDIMEVRCQTDPRWPDQSTSEDNYSDHYCMYFNDTPIGSLGVTRALDGDLFLQEYCPPQVLDQFHDLIVSAYRFRILERYRQTSTMVPGISVSRQMVREAWREQMSKGAALDVINIETTHINLYKRMGYILCDGSEYLDPEIGTPSCIMLLPIDPSRKSFVSDIIEQEAKVFLTLDEVNRCLTRKKVYVNAR